MLVIGWFGLSGKEEGAPEKEAQNISFLFVQGGLELSVEMDKA